MPVLLLLGLAPWAMAMEAIRSASELVPLVDVLPLVPVVPVVHVLVLPPVTRFSRLVRSPRPPEPNELSRLLRLFVLAALLLLLLLLLSVGRVGSLPDIGPVTRSPISSVCLLSAPRTQLPGVPPTARTAVVPLPVVPVVLWALAVEAIRSVVIAAINRPRIMAVPLSAAKE